MRKIFSGSLVAAALGTAVMMAVTLPASAQISHALATGDNGSLLTLVKNDGGHSGGHVSGGTTMRGNGGMSARAQSDMRIRGNDRIRGDRRHMSSNGNWNNNGNWRHRRHRDGVGIGFGFYGYDAPYYAYAPEGYVDDGVAYCMSRFQSYDPGSGTYLGYDGFRHACP